MRRSTACLLGMLCALLLSGIVQAQVSTGAVSGTVKDSSGGVIAGANVVVLNEGTGASRTIVTDSDGHYAVRSLNLGNYRVTATSSGFATVVRTGIELTVGREEIVDLSLPVGSTTDSVKVTGDPPVIETTTASLTSLVNAREIRDLPLNGRSYDQLAALQPGIVLASPGPPQGSAFSFGTGQKFSVGGQRPNTNLFLLDGTNINDQANGTPGGAAGTNLGVDTILEFRIYTNSFKAEYGHSSGSVTTAVTRSGTNTLHGTAFEYIRNSALDARNYFDVGSDPPPFKRNQFGGVIGGPIRKDKTFFFAGYEGLRQGLGSTLTATVPTALARQGTLPTGNVAVSPAILPYLNLYPLPNGRDFGDGSAQYLSAKTIVTNEDNVMGRVDHQFNEKNSIFGRYTFDRDSVNAPQSIPFETAVNSDRRQYLTVQWNRVIGTNALNNFRFAYNRSTANTALDTSPIGTSLSFISGLPLGALQVGTIGTAGSRAITPLGPTSGGPNAWVFRTWQWADDFGWVVRKHSFKVGLDIQRMRDDFTNNANLPGAYTFTTFTTFLQAKPSNFLASFPVGQFFTLAFPQNIYAAYVQDDYTVSPRLTLNLGLRWEASTDVRDDNGKTRRLPTLASTATVAADTYYSTPKKNFEPRAGIAWQVDESGRTVLRVGGGIYHNQILPYFYQNLSRLPPFGNLSAANPPFPNAVTSLSASALLQFLAQNPEEKTPTNYQYNMSLQRQIFKDALVQVSYAGNTGVHLQTQIEGDSPIPTICSASLNNCPAGLADGAYFIPLNSPRRNTAWGGIRYFQTNGYSRYDSGTVMVRRAAASGLQIQVSYSLSRARDNSSGISPGESQRSPQSAENPENQKAEWGLSDFDSRHTVVGYLTYLLPFHVNSRALGAVTNGWTVNGIGTYRSGLPLTPLLATGVSRNLSSAGIAERPNLKAGFSNNPNSGVSAGCGTFLGGKVGTATNWYDPCAFSLPIAGSYGNLGRNTVIGPALSNIDLSLQKDFKLTERFKAAFRAEMFNALNHANFGLPNTTALASGGAANPAAGSITYTVTSARQLQFALRLSF